MFTIETLEQLVQRARRAFRTHLPGSDAWLWPNNINPTAKVIGGMTNQVMEFADYIQRQKFALTADEENLAFHGEEYGIPRKPAAPGAGQIVISTTLGVDVVADAVFERADGVQFLAVNGGSIAGSGDLALDVIAVVDGKTSNSPAETPITIISGVTGDDAATAQVGSGGIVNGTDIEDVESWRSRILFRKRNPPHGGAPADYVMWAGEVSGVSFVADRPTVFVERRWAGAGSVRVFPLMFGLYANGIPSDADVQRVADYIQTVCPAGVELTVAAPIAHEIDIVINGLVPNRTDVQEAVRAELASTFRRLGRVAGNDDAIGAMPYLASPQSFSRSWIWQAVANASGEERHSIVSPGADIPLAAGEFPVLGTITFT
jgi:uncharacterized phage protein gp47/JayE